MQNQISNNWQKVKLGDVTEYVNRGIPPVYTQDTSGTAVINQKCIRNDQVDFGLSRLTDESVKPISQDKLLQQYDILINSTGTGTVGRVGQIMDLTKKATVDTHVTIVRPKKKEVDPAYLAIWLKSQQEKLENLAEGSSNQVELSRNKIANVEVILPPLKIQQKIADILSSVDEAIQKTNQIIQKTEVLKQGLMNELLTKGIRHKKFKKTKLREIPEEWKILQMRDVCTVRQGLQIAIKERKTEAGNNRYLYLTNQYLKNPEKHEYVEDPPKNVICNEDDILMTRTGNTGIVVTNVKGVFHNNFFLINYDRNQVDKIFLVYYLQSTWIQNLILDRAGSTTIPDLNHGDFYSLPLFLPSLNEQIAISKIFQSLDKKIYIEKNRLIELKKIKNGVMHDIFTQRIHINNI